MSKWRRSTDGKSNISQTSNMSTMSQYSNKSQLSTKANSSNLQPTQIDITSATPVVIRKRKASGEMPFSASKKFVLICLYSVPFSCHWKQIAQSETVSLCFVGKQFWRTCQIKQHWQIPLTPQHLPSRSWTSMVKQKYELNKLPYTSIFYHINTCNFLGTKIVTSNHGSAEILSWLAVKLALARPL